MSGAHQGPRHGTFVDQRRPPLHADSHQPKLPSRPKASPWAFGPSNKLFIETVSTRAHQFEQRREHQVVQQQHKIAVPQKSDDQTPTVLRRGSPARKKALWAAYGSSWVFSYGRGQRFHLRAGYSTRAHEQVGGELVRWPDHRPAGAQQNDTVVYRPPIGTASARFARSRLSSSATKSKFAAAR